VIESGAELSRLRNVAVKALIRLAVAAGCFAMAHFVWASPEGAAAEYVVGSTPLGPILIALTVLLTRTGRR